MTHKKLPMAWSSDKRVLDIMDTQNTQEQYTRSWCVRIKGLSVPDKLINTFGIPSACLKHVYNSIVHPVLKHAVEDDVIDPLRGFDDVLENGHFVNRGTTTRDGRTLPPTIIVRFTRRIHRNVFLQYKKRHMPEPNDADSRNGISYYSATPDLTKINRSILHSLRQDDRVERAWSRDHRMFFSLKMNPQIKHFIPSMHHTISDLIKRATAIVRASPPPQHHNISNNQLQRHHQPHQYNHQHNNHYHHQQQQQPKHQPPHAKQHQSPMSTPAQHETPNRHSRSAAPQPHYVKQLTHNPSFPRAQQQQQHSTTPACTRSKSQHLKLNSKKKILPASVKAGTRRSPAHKSGGRHTPTPTTATASLSTTTATASPPTASHPAHQHRNRNTMQSHPQATNRFEILPAEVSDSEF